ncbi:MAG: hypothetical protein M0R33_13755 [Methylomonas sp.]|jgi:hypothetical protein|uniref:hypothetical protein n=1 Tax=Methylomonas sp. TaxID=418 RepID=UPI0025F38B07|nr:hypothetical protein [Methylomonas sp.]MCK9607500.1 hypothetical protein [Methylomonas sp.]
METIITDIRGIFPADILRMPIATNAHELFANLRIALNRYKIIHLSLLYICEKLATPHGNDYVLLKIQILLKTASRFGELPRSGRAFGELGGAATPLGERCSPISADDIEHLLEYIRIFPNSEEKLAEVAQIALYAVIQKIYLMSQVAELFLL